MNDRIVTYRGRTIDSLNRDELTELLSYLQDNSDFLCCSEVEVKKYNSAMMQVIARMAEL